MPIIEFENLWGKYELLMELMDILFNLEYILFSLD